MESGMCGRPCKLVEAATLRSTMTVRTCSIVALGALLWACGAAPKRGSKERTPLRPTLILEAVVPGQPVVGSAAELLAAARSNQRHPTGALVLIAELRWRDQTFGARAIADAIAVRARSYFPEADHRGVLSQSEFEARYGQPYEAFWQVLMAGYLEQLEQTYGVIASSADLTGARDLPGHALMLVTNGALPESADGGGEYHVQFRGGRFELSGLAPARATPSAPPSVADVPPGSIETVVWARAPQYYVYPGFNATEVRFDASGIGAKPGFVGQIRRAYAEVGEYVTSSGRSLQRTIPIARYDPYFKLRPRDVDPFDLDHDLHLVRVTFDDSALPGSALMTSSLAVIDGSAEYPLSMSEVYQQAARRFDAVWRLAQAALQQQVAGIERDLRARSQAWARQQAGGRLDTSTRDFIDIQPRFVWSRTNATITISFSFENRVTHIDLHSVADPELARYHCPDGRVCDLPPSEIEERHEQSYTTRVEATYTFDRTGALIAESSTEPTVSVEP
jgi:hypothetical protein